MSTASVAAPTIVWLRDELRLADNPALVAALEHGGQVVVVVVRDETSPEVRPLGAAARWWWHHSLAELASAIADRGGALVLRTGPAERVIPQLVAETGAAAVHWNRRYTPARALDARLMQRLRDDGVEVTSFAGSLLVEPWNVATGQGGPYRVFTPFWRAVSAMPMRPVLAAPRRIPSLPVESEPLDDWQLLPTRPDWAAGLRANWTPGERGAHARLERFVEHGLAAYDRRDVPGIEATSRLSPHLRFGELSPAHVWERVHHSELSPAARRNVAKFASELGWREFSAHLLFHEPSLPSVNFRRDFDAFPWSAPDPRELEAWQTGRTGIELVDAGMRELWTTGWMHNRARMIAASFLTKNLLVDWRVGEAWFWDTLVDADEANNPASWQWVAGSGADAAPYFRIFNPDTQAERFDPDGAYRERWIPERGTPRYPPPIVDLGQTRREALAAYEIVKAARQA